MLNAIPRSWLSWDFRILDGGREVAVMDMSFWREKGGLSIDGVLYRAHREGRNRGAFILEAPGGQVLAKAEKPNALRRRFVVECGGRRLWLEAWTPFGRAFVLRDDQRYIGIVKPDNFVTRRTTANLPEDLPLPVRVFFLWLVFILWRRDDRSANAAPVDDSGCFSSPV
jgi:hypothetical protein